ncbi:MAG: biopolymer transporter ExbD [Candidatus Latescibacterota bacterium]
MPNKRKDEPRLEPAMDMTPMIDCVFLLLIFFMVTTVFKNPAQLKMTLPDAYFPTKLDSKQITIELDAEGTIAIAGKQATIDQFDSYLVNEKQKSGTKSVVIRADKAAKHGDVLRLMRLAKGVGIETIALSADNKGVDTDTGPITAFDRAKAKRNKK